LNAEIDDISTTDGYKEQLGKIKQLIGERGNTIVDELIERKAVTKDIKAIGHISLENTRRSIKTVRCVGV
jgi:hypothetical protein